MNTEENVQTEAKERIEESPSEVVNEVVDSTSKDTDSSEVKKQDVNSEVKEAKEGVEAVKIQVKKFEPHESVFKFVETFVTIFDKKIIESDLRRAENGIFFPEERLDQLLELYNNFLIETFGAKDKLSFTKALSRLLGSNEISQVYILEGKTCKAGYNIALGEKKPSVKLPIYKGKSLSAVEFLHPRDPLFRQIDSLSSRMGKNGLEFQLDYKKRKLRFDPTLLRRFITLAKYSTKTLKIYDRFNWSQREALKAFVAIFKKSRLVGESYSLVIPSFFRKEKNAEYYNVANYYFVVVNDEIKFCYELRGKNLSYFLRSQIDGAKFTLKDKETKYFGPKGRSKHWGYFFLRGNKYPMKARAFLSFYERFYSSQANLKAISNRHSTRDLLSSFGELLVKAEKLSSPGLINSLSRKPGRNEECREIDKQVFLLSQNYEIREYFHRYEKSYNKKKANLAKSSK